MVKLSIHNVSKVYNGHTALEQVSMEIHSQKIFGLLGPNGAGKTSLIRIITQITAADNGEIYFNNELLSRKHISKIGYMPEERGLYKKMKVGEQLLYLTQLKGMEYNLALENLKQLFIRFEIQNWWEKKIEDLSKGMQQKIQFIATISHKPELIILDEPFTGFDPINTQMIIQEILSLRDQGATVILSTHRMESVEEVCDDIVLINKSKNILGGGVKDIKNKFRQFIYEVDYSGNFPLHLFEQNIDFELIKSTSNGKNLATVLLKNNKKSNDLLQFLFPFIEINGFREQVPSLNEIFIQKVKENN